jgi:hypothetical protein
VDANFQEVETKYNGTVAAKEAAESARDKAGEWAENPEDVEVETGKYSALHHASKAAQSAIVAEAAAHGIQTGESTFAGQVGQTVSISTVASADYHVDITPLAESGRIGEIWISTRAVNAFVVKNSGSDVSSAFAWRISGAALAS